MRDVLTSCFGGVGKSSIQLFGFGLRTLVANPLYLVPPNFPLPLVTIRSLLSQQLNLVRLFV